MPFKIGVIGLLLVLANSSMGAQAVLSPIRYDVGFQVDYDAEVLRGTARIVVQNPSPEPVREASLLLYRLLRVKTVLDDQGKELAFSQAVVAFEDFGKLQVNQILVTLPQPLAPGAQTAVDIRYEGYLLGYAETGMRYIQDRLDPAFTILRDDSYAYPRPGFPSSAVNRSAPEAAFSYSARITVPKGFTVANGGHLDGTDTLGEAVTFRYSRRTTAVRAGGNDHDRQRGQRGRAANVDYFAKMVDKATLEEAFKLADVPEQAPAFFGLDVDACGRWWVLRTSMNMDAPATFDVLSSVGVPLTTVTLADHLASDVKWAVGRSRLAAIVQDDDGAPTLGVYRLPNLPGCRTG